jgi:formylglycine-generating enzyme required for sulfatase activity
MIGLLVLALMFVIGCGDDPVAPQYGAITIDPEPDSINAPWQLTGPEGFVRSGVGNASLSSLVSGGYSVTWGTVEGWTPPNPASVAQTLAGSGVLVFSGVHIAEAGTITIDPEPNKINAPWRMDGPNEFSKTGSGDAILTNMFPGDYTLTWGLVSGWESSPAMATQTMTANGSLTFTGTHVSTQGTITIDANPDYIGAPWQIRRPDGFSQSGVGDATITQVATGRYIISWGKVVGWKGAGVQDTTALTVFLTSGETGAFLKNYAVEANTVTINPAPGHLKAPWRLLEPKTSPRDGVGFATLIVMPAGDYTLTWGDVDGWAAPNPAENTQTLAIAETLTFEGTYTAEAGAIIIQPGPEAIMAPWRITGPDGFDESGAGYAVLTGRTAGTYTLTWGELTGWTRPDPAVLTLVLDGTLTFSGQYGARTGTFRINAEPEYLNAPWRLSYGLVRVETGRGDTTLTNMPLGSYTMTWLDSAGWTKPGQTLHTLTAETEEVAEGTYVVQEGMITINPEPDSVDGPWQITGPGGFFRASSGDTVLTHLPIGTYTLIWGEVPGRTQPSPLSPTITIVANSNLVLTGQYVEQEGFVFISDGIFVMGSPVGESGRDRNEMQHEVTLSHGFYLQTTEVTNQKYMEMLQWAYVSGYVIVTSTSVRDNLDGSIQKLLDMTLPYSEIRFAGGVFSNTNPNHPVNGLTWYGAAAYCDWLSLANNLPRAYNHSTWLCNDGDVYQAGPGYRLPTEAEWEYACRARSGAAFTNGAITQPNNCTTVDPNLDLIGWYCGNAGGAEHAVAQKAPNSWGLYDMHGNLYEWCNDWFADYGGDAVDPAGPATGEYRVLRGGYWNYNAQSCRSGFRYSGLPGNHPEYITFRAARTAD